MIRRGQPGSVTTMQGHTGIQAVVVTQPIRQTPPQTSQLASTTDKPKRALPPTPTPTEPVLPTSTVAPKSQFFPKAVELPQPPEGGDINVQVRHWARISGEKYSPQQIALALENAKKLIDTGLVDFASAAPKGNTAIHNAALVNNISFIDYVMTHPKYSGKVDINLYNTQANSNALGDAIVSNFFKLAIKLIQTYEANVNGEVRLVRNDTTFRRKYQDNTSDLLRMAFIFCLNKDPNELSEDHVKDLDLLIKILIDKKLNFFKNQNAFIPAVLEFENYWLAPIGKDNEIMERASLDNEENSKLRHLDNLKKFYPLAFQAFWTQLKNENDSGNKIANNFWRIWHAREIANSKTTLCSVVQQKITLTK